MSRLSLYLIASILLFSFGFVTLRYLVPHSYLKHGKLSSPMVLLQTLLFFLYGGFPYIYLDRDWPGVSVSLIPHIIGVFLVFLGLGVLFDGMVQLGFTRFLGRGEPRLVHRGIYRSTRNPQAMACGAYVIGFLMLWPSWYALGWVMLYFVYIQMMVSAEEQHLRRVLGHEYDAYCSRVPRYIRMPGFG